MSAPLVVAANQGPDQPKRRLENLALTDPIPGPEHERKKGELRARLKREHEAATKIKTVTTQAEIAIRDAAYWAHPPELRLKYIKEAEEARAKWARIEKEQSKRGRPPKVPDEPAVTEVTSATGPLKVGPIIFEREMMRRTQRDNRKCPDCGTQIGPRKRYCAVCGERHRKLTNRANQRQWQKKRRSP